MYVVAGLVLVGVVLGAYPLIKSLSPNAKALANVRTLSAAKVPVGSLQIFEEGGAALIVARPKPGEFLIFEAFRLSEAHSQPRYLVASTSIECSDFELTAKTVRCRGLDRPSPEWTLDGKLLSDIHEKVHWYPDLEPLPYSVLGDTVRYGRGA